VRADRTLRETICKIIRGAYLERMSFPSLRILLVALTCICASSRCFTQISPISINEIFANNQDLINPDGSISDWVELYNNGTEPVSLAGYSLTDSASNPKKWVFPANVVIAPKGFLLVLLDSGQPASSVSGSPLNTGFSLKAGGDRIELYSPTTLIVESVRFGPQAANYSIGRVPAAFRSFVLCTPTAGSANNAQSLGAQTDLRINEWMASPSSGNDWFELHNTNALPVQLTGLSFTDDGNTPSPVAPLSYIGTGRYGYLQIFADNSTNDNEVNFKLGGGGDSISLLSAASAQIDSVRFGQQTADVSQGRLPDGSANIKSLNAATPGESNLTPYQGLVVNELLSHTDPPFEDAVELYNQTAAGIDIGGWYLSNKRSDLKKYLVPNGTIVPANGYLVIYEGQFNRSGDPNAFTFNSAHGDEVYLAQANAAGDLSGLIVSETFEAAANGVSFGRYDTSVPGDYKFVAMERRTFGVDRPSSVEQFRTGKGAVNSAPKIGPVVINEIMYHPPSTATDGSDNVADEYIELRNLASASVLLYDPLFPANLWKLQGGVNFTFPSGATLPALGYALIVSFSPSTDTQQLAAFRAKYAVPTGVQIFGPYDGKLNNGGDPVEIYSPDPPQLPPHPDAGFVPYIRVDKVNFRDLAPWPTDADGTGKSLQRKNSNAFGNDPVNWQSAAPSAGKSNSAEVLDSDGDGLPDVWEGQYGLNPNDPSDAATDSDQDGFTNLQEFLAGTDPKNASSRLTLRVSAGSTGPVQLTFSSIAGRSYSVQYRNNLLPSTTWQKLVSTNATANEIKVEDSDTAGRSARFYRIATPATD
jgi:hypothetical protein